MLEYVVGGIIGALTGVLCTYVIMKKMFKPLEIAEDLMDFIISDTEMQKKIYLLGALLGNGIKSGIGLNPKRGKFRFEDLIGMALSQFLAKKQGEVSGENPFQKLLSGG